jgi:GDP/UDP-N,N'-diacetylbacillosamine 2-epimerase (hydrolysing)
MMRKKICVITGSRAEYGLLRWLMTDLREDPAFELQLIVTGMHLSPEFGLTYREIESDGFCIDRKLEMLVSSDSPTGISKSMGLGLIAFGEAFAQLQPDLVLVLGDRFEIFSATAAAMVAALPVAHLHGGERTEGAFDEAIRHSITKMSHLHFVAAEEYRRRVIQLGEDPAHVFLSGGLGVDAIHRVKLLDRPSLELSLDFKFGSRNLLVTFHPETLNAGAASIQMLELLEALDAMKDVQLLFTMPNADSGGRALIEILNDFVATHSNAKAFTSLGQVRYLSCLAQVDCVIGNSSSGLTEMPSFRKATINIGDRQRGRLKASSVIDCEPNRFAITAAVNTAYSAEFQAALMLADNPYGDGGASQKILDVMKRVDLAGVVKKSFHDL